MFVNRTDRPDTFNSVEFTVTKRRSKNWNALAALNLTKSHKWLQAQATAPYQVPFALDETWDYSVKANVAYEFPRDISAGLNYHYLAGTPNYATDQITGVPQLGTITIPLESFGTRRNPALSILNARAAKGFAMKGNKKFVATVELFNALNSSVGTSINYQYGAVGTAREFGFVSTVVPPMIGRIGFEFKF